MNVQYMYILQLWTHEVDAAVWHTHTHTPVFDSDEVADQAVGRTALHKVLLGCQKPL